MPRVLGDGWPRKAPASKDMDIAGSEAYLERRRKKDKTPADVYETSDMTSAVEESKELKEKGFIARKKKNADPR